MKRAVVCVATTPHYQKGMARLRNRIGIDAECAFWNREPDGSPTHADVQYAFKAYALQHAAEHADLLLWCDACILPIRSLEPLWKRIEEDGYWMSRNGWNNYQWTADHAYEDLFTFEGPFFTEAILNEGRQLNKTIPHVVATSFGLNVRHPKGDAFLREYFRLASTTKAFCGPWWNLNNAECPTAQARQELGLEKCPRCAPCGPPDVRGHRHDQTAASVIAWRLGFNLTDPPNIFAYANFKDGGKWSPDHQDESTSLVAHGSY